jgi:lipopolysaccharide export system permease protein
VRLITRYVAQLVAGAILLVLAVLLGLNLIIGLLDQSGDLTANYDLGAAFYYTLLTLPSQVFHLLPFAVLIGCLAGLGTLAGSSELIVIRTAGVSVLRILWMVLRPALLVTLIGLLVAEYVAPPLQQIAQSYRAMRLQKTDISISEYGLWHREGNSFVHLNAVQPNGELFGITVFTLDETRHLQSALFALRAIYQGDHWLFEDVRETRFFPDHLERDTAAQRRWDTQLSPELLNILVLDPVDLSISGLWRYVRFLRDQGSSSGAYELALWNKLLQPLGIISLVLVATSIIFGPLRQSSMGFRVFVGLLIGIVFRISQDMLGPASLVCGFAPLLASLTPSVVSMLVGLAMLRRRL